MIFIRKANLVPWYLLFLLILRHWEARRVPRRHNISSKTWYHGLSLISNNPHTRCEHLCIIFSASAPSRPNLFSITGIKVMTSGIAFDHPNRLSRLRAFPYDRFKIYTIVLIVRIELNSIQAIKVVSVVRVVCDRLSRVSSRSSEHFLTRLGRSGWSGRLYGNQAITTTTTTFSTTTGSELRNTAQARPVNFVVVVSSTSPNKVESHRPAIHKPWQV